jgi:hypothetical protein
MLALFPRKSRVLARHIYNRIIWDTFPTCQHMLFLADTLTAAQVKQLPIISPVSDILSLKYAIVVSEVNFYDIPVQYPLEATTILLSSLTGVERKSSIEQYIKDYQNAKESIHVAVLQALAILWARKTRNSFSSAYDDTQASVNKSRQCDKSNMRNNLIFWGEYQREMDFLNKWDERGWGGSAGTRLSH